MHRQAQNQALGQGRRLRVRSQAGFKRFLWMLGYIIVGLGTLFTTFFFPNLRSLLRSHRQTVQPYLLPQVRC